MRSRVAATAGWARCAVRWMALMMAPTLRRD